MAVMAWSKCMNSKLRSPWMKFESQIYTYVQPVIKNGRKCWKIDGPTLVTRQGPPYLTIIWKGRTNRLKIVPWLHVPELDDPHSSLTPHVLLWWTRNLFIASINSETCRVNFKRINIWGRQRISVQVSA